MKKKYFCGICATCDDATPIKAKSLMKAVMKFYYKRQEYIELYEDGFVSFAGQIAIYGYQLQIYCREVGGTDRKFFVSDFREDS